MKKLRILAALAALAAAPAFAQALGTVTSVNGVATVTSGANATAVSQGMPLQSGSRIVTTNSSTVVVRLNNGCTLTVPPGHGVTLVPTLTCQQQQAALQPVNAVAVVPATTVMGQRAGDLGMSAPVAVWAAALAAAVIYDATNDHDDAPISGR